MTRITLLSLGREDRTTKPGGVFLEGEDVVKFAIYPVCVVELPSVNDLSSHLFQVYFCVYKDYFFICLSHFL